MIGPADHVLHRPSGETWVVAYADYGTGFLAWCGWPEGQAKIEDCERTYVAADDERDAMIRRWAKRANDRDHRGRTVVRLYGRQALKEQERD